MIITLAEWHRDRENTQEYGETFKNGYKITGLMVNICTLITRKTRKRGREFKYLDVTSDSENNMHCEVNLRLFSQ